MGIALAGESLICIFIAVSFLSTNAIPLEDEEGPEDESSRTYADSPRHRKDLSDSGSTELVQAILPVQVDIGSLVSGFDDHIDEMRENMINVDEKLEIVKANQARMAEENGQLKSRGEENMKIMQANQARMEEENARLIEHLKASIANETKARRSLEKETARLIEQLKVFQENETEARNATTAKPETPDSQTPAPGNYVFTDGTMNWDAARAECKSRGSDLATHLTKEDVDYVFSKVIPSGMYSVWTGGRMNARATEANFESSFEWLDGHRISVDDGLWRENEPDFLSQKCMYIHRGPFTRKDGTRGPAFQTARCSDQTFALCQR